MHLATPAALMLLSCTRAAETTPSASTLNVVSCTAGAVPSLGGGVPPRALLWRLCQVEVFDDRALRFLVVQYVCRAQVPAEDAAVVGELDGVADA
jgi:hypothetical protein